MQTILTNPTVLLIALAWVAFVLYWVYLALGARPKRRALNAVLSLLMIAAVTSLFFLLRPGTITESYNPRLWQRSLPVGIAADIIVFGGVFLFLWARRTLGSNWNASTATAQDHELVQTGPYAYVRHPIYSGFLTMVLGTAIAYGRLLGVLILVVSIAGLYVKAMREESLLLVRFPTDYPPYRAKTNALIPYLL